MNLFKNWREIRRLGSGSFGTVYEVENTDPLRAGERAALKKLVIPKDESEIEVLRGDRYDDAGIAAVFLEQRDAIVNEYRLMREVSGHTNIVNCLDMGCVGHEDGLGWDVFIVMELLRPLRSVPEERFTEEEIVRLGKDLSRALVVCEKHGIIHRDIKPDNIFLSGDGDYKLGDFGIARVMESGTHGASTMAGTPEYMAPEVLSSRKYGRSVDIYAVGLVLYWLLNERRMPFLPLTGRTTLQERQTARTRRFSGDPIPAPAHGSAGLKRIVLKACAFRPEDRYRSAGDLLRDLEDLERARETEQEEETVLERTVRAGTGKEKAEPPPEKTEKAGTDPQGPPGAAQPGPAPSGAGPGETESPPRGDGTYHYSYRKQTGGTGNGTKPEESGIPGRVRQGPGTARQTQTPKTPGERRTAGRKQSRKTPEGKTEQTDGKRPGKPRRKGKKLLFPALVLLMLIGAFRTVHFWKPATCEEASVCRICGQTRGQALGHDWGEWTAVENPADPSVVELVRTCRTDASHTERRYLAADGEVSGEDIVSAAAGTWHTVGLRRNGTAVAAGENGDGRCDVGGWHDLVAVAAGGEFTLGLRRDGTVLATGTNRNNACSVEDWTGVTAIAACGEYSAGLRRDGTVLVSGADASVIGEIGGWSRVAQIAVGERCILGLRDDGTVLAARVLRRLTDFDVSGWQNITAVDTGTQHAFGLRSDGTVVVTGSSGSYGADDVSGWRDIVAIAAGYNFTVGLRSDGTVVATGDNSSGQCNVGGWRDVVAIEAGWRTTVGVTRYGTVLIAGDNSEGQCSVGDW